MNLQSSFNGEQKSQVKFKALRPKIKMKNNEIFLPEGKIMKIWFDEGGQNGSGRGDEKLKFSFPLP